MSKLGSIARMMGATEQIEGVIARIGVFESKDGLKLALEVEERPGQLFTTPCDSSDYAITQTGDRVSFAYHPKRPFKKFHNATLG